MTDSLETVMADTIDTVTIYYYDEAEKNLISRSIYDSAVSPNPDKISEYVCRVVPLKVTLLRVSGLLVAVHQLLQALSWL